MVKENSKKTNELRQRSHDSVDKLTDKLESMEKQGKEAMTRVKEKGTMIKKNVNEHIKKNPGKSILIAAGAGIVAGAIFAAALMKKKGKGSSK